MEKLEFWYEELWKFFSWIRILKEFSKQCFSDIRQWISFCVVFPHTKLDTLSAVLHELVCHSIHIIIKIEITRILDKATILKVSIFNNLLTILKSIYWHCCFLLCVLLGLLYNLPLKISYTLRLSAISIISKTYLDEWKSLKKTRERF